MKSQARDYQANLSGEPKNNAGRILSFIQGDMQNKGQNRARIGHKRHEMAVSGKYPAGVMGLVGITNGDLPRGQRTLICVTEGADYGRG